MQDSPAAFKLLGTMGYFTLLEERDGALRAEVFEVVNGERQTLALLAFAPGPNGDRAVRELLRVALESSFRGLSKTGA